MVGPLFTVAVAMPEVPAIAGRVEGRSGAVPRKSQHSAKPMKGKQCAQVEHVM